MQTDLSKIHFVDVETVPQFKSADELLSDTADLFYKRHHREILDECDKESLRDPDAETAEYTFKAKRVYAQKAGLQAEFGKVVAISIGRLKGGVFRIKSLTGRHEKELLQKFLAVSAEVVTYCGHNIKEFDLPYLYRRFLINDMDIPSHLKQYAKSWENPHIDTMEMWSGSQFKYKCSLDLLAHSLGIPSSKQDMSGADVAKIYYGMFDSVSTGELPFDKEAEALRRIGQYCNEDVRVAAQVFCKLTRQVFPDKVEYNG